MERHFDEELKNLKQTLLRMADTAQAMLGLSVQALAERNPARAEEVAHLEEQVNRSEIEIEEEALRLLATRQPAAGDLRLLTAILKINNDLERVGDQACNISETVRFLLKEPPLKPLPGIPHMASLAQTMIRQSLEAFVNQDAALAKKVCEHDDDVDRLNEGIFKELLAMMTREPASVTRAVDLILIARNIERVADHATNICEDVIFIVQGKNIKHHIEEVRESPSL